VRSRRGPHLIEALIAAAQPKVGLVSRHGLSSALPNFVGADCTSASRVALAIATGRVTSGRYDRTAKAEFPNCIVSMTEACEKLIQAW